MTGRPLRIAWEDEAETLIGQYRAEQDAQIRPRLQALWLLRSGRNLAETAQVVGMHYRTVQQWVTWYRSGGLAAVPGHRKAGVGRRAWLTPEQEQALVAQAAAGTLVTARDAQPWVAERFGVTYTRNSMYSLLS